MGYFKKQTARSVVPTYISGQRNTMKCSILDSNINGMLKSTQLLSRLDPVGTQRFRGIVEGFHTIDIPTYNTKMRAAIAATLTKKVERLLEDEYNMDVVCNKLCITDSDTLYNFPPIKIEIRDDTIFHGSSNLTVNNWDGNCHTYFVTQEYVNKQQELKTYIREKSIYSGLMNILGDMRVGDIFCVSNLEMNKHTGEYKYDIHSARNDSYNSDMYTFMFTPGINIVYECVLSPTYGGIKDKNLLQSELMLAARALRVKILITETELSQTIIDNITDKIQLIDY
ncbi:hypothetical protein [Microcystis phage Mel-JY01]